MPNPLLSFLQGGGGANVPLQLAALRQARLREAGPIQDTSQLQSEIAEDPYTGKVAQAETTGQDKLRQMLFEYNRPDVRAQREEELANEIRVKTAPAETAGRYNVEAARIAGPYRVSAAEATAQGKEDVAERGAETQTANRQAIALRQRLAALQKQGRPGWYGQLTGEGVKYDTELAQILQQLGISSDEATAAPGELGAVAAPPAPPGWQYVPKPGGGWTAIEMR